MSQEWLGCGETRSRARVRQRLQISSGPPPKRPAAFQQHDLQQPIGSAARQVTPSTSLRAKEGTKGEVVNLKSNYFKLQKHTDWVLQQYRVDFSPDDERNVIRKALLRVHKEFLGPYVFDGTVLYTAKVIASDPYELYSSRTSDDVKIKITIKRTTDLMMGDAHYIQFFNIVLRKCVAGLNLQLVGRNYYDAESRVCVNKHNLELWPGVITSIRQHENSILLGVELSNKIMRRDTAMDLYLQLQREPGRWQEHFLQAVVGTTVITRYNNKTYRVDDVDFESNPLCTFEKGNEQISYVDYYYQRYKIIITNTTQPLLVSRPKKKDLHGGRINLIVLIPELCCLTGLTENMRNNFHLMRELEVHTRLHPTERMNKVITFMTRLTSNTKAKEELTLWNLKFSSELIDLTGRIFLPEKIVHGAGETSISGKDADWTRTLRGHPLYYSKQLHRWTIIYLHKMSREVHSFVTTLINASASLQFRIQSPTFEEINDDRCGTYVHAIEKVASRQNPQLIICIVPNNKADRYAAIKKKCCVDRPIPSQVVLARTLTNKNVMSIATKIGIQLNCKIGGSPWSVVVPFKKPVMIAGFDVCHDSAIKGRSFGALVASLDGAYSRYHSAVSPHTSGEELSNDLGIHLQKAVFVYRNINGFFPPKIILYRDSVGEGNEHYVLTHETEIIRSKLQETYQSEQLQMAFVIVSKRVHTKFFYNGRNPPPGTIVDDVVTNPIKYDFFLVSQSVRQGTAAPTLYNVIYDTTQLPPDIMQQLTYKMTHLYYNWSGTVRVPAPAQYAHKLAYLCSQHLHRQPNENLCDFLYYL